MYEFENHLNEDGLPAGGHVRGIGLSIDWQNGPLSVDGERKAPNGAFVETVLEAALQRIKHYQELKFACSENADAIVHITAALVALRSRTARREAQGIEGTWAKDPD